MINKEELICGVTDCKNPTTEILKIKIKGKEVHVCILHWNELKVNK